MSILNETGNFFRLYRYLCGKSEVPDIYHFWATVSLIAAVVEDRVYYQKFKHEKLYPNLFVMLVGPSGLGKGTAIGHLMRLVEKSVHINKYRGRLTAAHLIDYLGKPTIDAWGQQMLASPKLWLIMDELQNDIIGSNKKMVEDFVYLMTELYTASNYKIQAGTRGSGQVNIEAPILNWFCGTNEDDLREILSKKMMNTGFTARTCFVFGEYDFGKRIPRIQYPDDYEEIFQHLQCRLWMMQRTTGRFLMTTAAEAESDKWYEKRPSPVEELLYSAWKRQHDSLLKFAMILCLADGGPLVIKYRHIVQAQKMVDKMYHFSEKLISIASETFNTRPVNEIARYIRRKGRVEHTRGSRYFRTTRGIDSVTFRRATMQLFNEGLIAHETTQTGATVYVWVQGGKV